MTKDHKDYTATLLNKDGEIKSNGAIFRNSDKVYFVTAGHAIYGIEFELTPDINDLIIRSEKGADFTIKQLISDLTFSKKFELSLIELNCSDDISVFQTLLISSIPKDDKVDLFFRGNASSSAKKYTYKNKLKFSDTDPTEEYRFDLSIDQNLLINDKDQHGSAWMTGFSGSMLFSDKTIVLCALGVLIEIPNNGNYSQIKFTGLEPLRQLLPEIKCISYKEIQNQFKKKNNLSEEELQLFKFTFNVENYIEREVLEKEESSNKNISLSYFQLGNIEKLNTRFLKDEIKNHDIINLIGNPGIGKTTELKKITIDITNSISSDYLARYYHINNFTIQDQFDDFIGYEKFKDIDKVLFVFDGIDEIPDPQDFLSKFDSFYSSLIEHGRKHKFIISYRTVFYNNELKTEHKHADFELKNLSPVQSKELFEKIIGKKLSPSEINEIERIIEFLSNPTKVKLVASYYQKTTTIESNIAKLWEGYIIKILGSDKDEKFKKKDVTIPRIKQNSTKLSILNELMQSTTLDEDKLFQLIPEGDSYNEFIYCALLDKQPERPQYFFEDKELQEYFVANFLIGKEFQFVKKFLCIENTECLRPSLNNVFTFLINNLDKESELFIQLINWIKEKSPELIFKSEINRVQELRIPMFQAYFEEQYVNKTLWIGSNNLFTIEEFIYFGNVKENFNYLIDIISNTTKNRRTRLSAIKALGYFTLFDEDKLTTVLFKILENSNIDLSFKSSILKLLTSLKLNFKNEIRAKVFKIFKDESNKELNQSLLKFIIELPNTDNYFKYIKQEFEWAHNITSRKEKDEVTQGNSWLLQKLILNLTNENHFLSFAIHYLDDYKLNSNERFKTNLIDRFIYFFDKNPKLIYNLLDLLASSNNHRNRNNEKTISELIIKCNEELNTFKKLYSSESIAKPNWLLASISTKETVKFVVNSIDIDKFNKLELQSFRNVISYYKDPKLAILFEKSLKKKGIDLGEPILNTTQKRAKIRELNDEAQSSFETLFEPKKIVSKIEDLFQIQGKEQFTTEDAREIELQFYTENKDWSRKLNIEIDILFALTRHFRIINFEMIKKLLYNSFTIQLIALKSQLESNKNSAYKFKVTNDHKRIIKKWIKTEVNNLRFDKIITYKDHNSFNYQGIEGLQQYKFLKTLYYFFDYKEFKSSFSQNFRLNSLEFYMMEEHDPFSESYKNLIDSIRNKQKVKEAIIKNISGEFFTLTALKQMVYALNNNIIEVFPRIREYLPKSDKVYQKNSFFELYLNSSKDKELLLELSMDTSVQNGWTALYYLSLNDQQKHKTLCIEKASEYLESEAIEFKSNALSLLFKFNSPRAIKYYLDNFDLNPLDNIPAKYINLYHIEIEVLIPLIKPLFNRIYSIMVKDEFAFSYHNSFFITLVSLSIFQSDDSSNSYKIICDILHTIKKYLAESDPNFDHQLFYINLITETIERNYINKKSVPLNFEKAFEQTNKYFN